MKVSPDSRLTRPFPIALVLALGGGVAPAQEYDVLRSMVPRDGHQGRDIAVGDVDGDGDADVFVAGIGSNGLYLNDGHGVFVRETATLPTGSASVAVGDVNGDDSLDLLLGGFALGGDLLLLNDGTGSFATTTLPAASNYSESAALLDVDGDSDLDGMLGDYGGIELLRNDGLGNFTHDAAATPPALGAFGCVFEIEGGDFDEDGSLDVFLGIGDDEAKNILLANDGSGNFTALPNAFPASPARDTRAVVVAEFNGDAHVDIVVGQWSLDELLPGNGTTTFPTSMLLPFGTGLSTDGLDVGDIEGDGDLDLFRASIHGSELLVNDGAGGFTVAEIPTANAYGSEQVILEDLDGDNDLDAFLASYRSRLLLGDGAGSFTGVPAGMPDGGYLQRLALGDANGDGRLDLFATSPAGELDRRLFLAGPSGEFEDASYLLPASDHVPGALATGDVDGDQDVDVIYGATGCSDAVSALFVNDGAGAFTHADTNLPNREALTEEVALADVDDDGDLDAYFANDSGCTAHDAYDFLYTNDGRGVFSNASTQLPFVELDSQGVAFGDLDGDDDPDAVLASGRPNASSGAQLNRVHLNDGAGTFSNVPGAVPGEARISVDVALADVENDGDLDVLFGNALVFFGPTGGNRLYLNQGNAVFVDASGQLPVNDNRTEGIYFIDQDDDGDVDIYEATSDVDGLWTNDGTGSFIATTGVLPDVSDFAGDVAIVDLDDDGDLDFLMAGPTHVLTGLRQQLARRELARLGHPLHMDVYTDAGSPWLLFYAFDLSELALPPFGTLGLSLGTLTLGASGTADGAGRATAIFNVPTGPALAGTSVWWQSLMGASPRFSNLELSAVSAL